MKDLYYEYRGYEGEYYVPALFSLQADGSLYVELRAYDYLNKTNATSSQYVQLPPQMVEKLRDYLNGEEIE